jgi:hypothetical protein
VTFACGWRAGTYEAQKLLIESCPIGVPLTYDFRDLLGPLSSFPSGSGSDRFSNGFDPGRSLLFCVRDDDHGASSTEVEIREKPEIRSPACYASGARHQRGHD